MQVHVDDLPRMESTNTSSTANSLATSACLFFHLSRPASAAYLSEEFATTLSGILVRGDFVRAFFPADFASEEAESRELAPEDLSRAVLAREGATLGASPSILRKWGGQGASPSPAASSLAASS